VTHCCFFNSAVHQVNAGASYYLLEAPGEHQVGGTLRWRKHLSQVSSRSSNCV